MKVYAPIPVYKDVLPLEELLAEPSTVEKIEAIQRLIGKAEYRLRIDAKRRPDGKTITKSMRQCIDELFLELELEN